MRSIFRLVFTFLILISISDAQSKIYEGPDDSAGDPGYKRIGYMSGNRVFLYFQNTTELSYCCGKEYSKWPNNDTGLPMTDGVALLIGAETFVLNDSIPDPWHSNPASEAIYFVQSQYREGMDINSLGTVKWGLYPPAGYSNENSDYLAMSNIPNSWPTAGWPSTGIGSTKWPGLWNGRFGAGIVYADLETFFVANDAQDQEYLQPNRRLKYYPRPNYTIGDKDPNVTRNYGSPWGGLGLRVETRGMQWDNAQSQDAIFWEYTIANVSDYDIARTGFGYWVDAGIGKNEEYDELGYYDTYLDLAFSWDIDMVSVGNQQPGVMGCAFLESPGNSTDGIDNDEDGLIDEKRDNHAVVFLTDSTQNIANMDNYIRAYGTPRPRWDADEDGDWLDGTDLNDDGIYQEQEFYGDDVGTDGVGPLELVYTGPDANGTECNHKPDFVEGLGSEPNFALTDVSESDMIGLTTFKLYGIPAADGAWPRNDDIMWATMSSNILEPHHFEKENLVLLFSSSTFPLYQGRTEHISMAMVHSMDYIAWGETTPSVPLLARKKDIVQVIYERDYRFATPPLLPTLTAAPVDGKVVLTWNDLADKRSKEPLLQNINDFEGYKLYKSTDKYFKDTELITNGFGEPTLNRPMYECDLIDGKTGFTDFGLVEGMAYYLGEDTGIKHYFIDNEVDNGVTYYYALVAYDYGVEDVGITPYETSMILDVDEYGEVRNQGINVAIVTPTQQAIGYVPPNVTIESPLFENNILLGNEVEINVLDNQNVKAGHRYKLEFISSIADSSRATNKKSPYDMKVVTNGYKISDITPGSEELLFIESPDSTENMAGNVLFGNVGGWPFSANYYPSGKTLLSDLAHGVQVSFTPENITSQINYENSGWVVGDSPMNVNISAYEGAYFPWEYEIVFSDAEVSTRTNFLRNIITADGTRLSTSAVLLDVVLNFEVFNKSFTDENGDYIKLDYLVYDVNGNSTFDRNTDEILFGHVVDDGPDKMRWGGTVFTVNFRGITDESDMPEIGDVFRLSFNRQLTERDSIVFTVNPEIEVVEQEITSSMDEINVVPNPYVATNRMEPALSRSGLNQQRRIMFTNIPASCKIKIFTVSGLLVKELVVENSANKGTVHWDLLTEEGLEIAAGMYIYHVKSDLTGDEKIGKFAVLK